MKNFNLLIIGDEILNGRRSDCHLQNAIELFLERGLQINRSFIIGDEPGLIVETLQYLRQPENITFSFGGIGATPDDYTRQCSALAFTVPLQIHPEGKAILQAKFGEKTWPHRINMVNIPAGSRLIPNPYSGIPGYSFENFHFLPGFPQMAKPMMQWVLDNEYRYLQPAEKPVRKTLRVYGKGEGELVDMMNALLQRYPSVRLSCLPRIDLDRNYVDLSVLADKEIAEQAQQFLIEAVKRMQLEWE